jgi:site-specific recombinase XerD
MIVDELITMFLDSRRRGVDGAKTQARPKTITTYQTMLKHFSRFLESRENPIGNYESIRRVHMIELVAWVESKMNSKEWSKATSIVFYKNLRVFFRWVDVDEDCREAGLKGLQRHIPAIPKMPARTFIPETRDLNVFKNSFNTDTVIGYRNYTAICLMLTNGMRIGEVCNLKVEQVKLDDKTVIADGKTGPRLVPITNDMVRVLKTWLARRRRFKKTAYSPYLFISCKEPQLTPNTFGKALKRLKKKNPKLKNITAHTLRHTFATLYLKGGGNMERLRDIMGHTSYEMLRNYLHNSKIGSKESLEELERINVLRQIK